MSVFNQHPQIRSALVCIGCGGDKPQGTLLCWPCHNREKNENDGAYSPRMMCTLNKFERMLTVCPEPTSTTRH